MLGLWNWELKDALEQQLLLPTENLHRMIPSSFSALSWPCHLSDIRGLLIPFILFKVSLFLCSILHTPFLGRLFKQCIGGQEGKGWAAKSSVCWTHLLCLGGHDSKRAILSRLQQCTGLGWQLQILHSVPCQEGLCGQIQHRNSWNPKAKCCSGIYPVCSSPVDLSAVWEAAKEVLEPVVKLRPSIGW